MIAGTADSACVGAAAGAKCNRIHYHKDAETGSRGDDRWRNITCMVVVYILATASGL